MKRNYPINLFLLVILVVAASCKTRRLANAPQPAAEPAAAVTASRSAPELLSGIRAKQFSYRTLSLKAKADLAMGKDNQDVNMNIRINRNRMIWVSITATIANIEVARALITPDSVKIVNRIQSIYTKKPFAFLKQYTNEQFDFGTLQAVLTGEAAPVALSGGTPSEENGRVLVKGAAADLVYSLVFNPDFQLASATYQAGQGKQLGVTYADFTAVANQRFPSLVTANSVADNKNISIKLKYSNVSVNEALEFPFSAPARYTVDD
jgi:hypothetical protein